ncbi:MAG: type II secretion system protein [Candidatus Omnitrophota bacterium]|nr:type II secretion system GspH family protein [Candidatus Omnitrophota bacterium]
MKRKGFTLIELVMVIVIIGILAAVAIPKFIDLRDEAAMAKCKATGGALRVALANYYANSALAGAAGFPASTASLTDYMQTAFDTPLVGATWDVSYVASTGVLDVDTACSI